jgi:hypothetical protein
MQLFSYNCLLFSNRYASVGFKIQYYMQIYRKRFNFLPVLSGSL